MPPSWGLVLDDTFTRADGPVGNGWVNTPNGTGTISSNTLHLTSVNGFENPTGGIVYNTSLGHDQRIVATFKGTLSTTPELPVFAFRANGGDNHGSALFTGYILWYNTGGTPSITVYTCPVAGGGPTLIHQFTVTLNLAHDLQFDIAVYGVNPTTFELTITDLTTSTVLLNDVTTNETVTSISTATGLVGIELYANGTPGTSVYSEAKLYAGTMAVVSFGVDPSAYSNVTHNSVKLVGVSQGGTAPISWSLYSSLTAGSFTNPAVATGTGNTLSFTDSAALAAPGAPIYYKWVLTDSTSPTPVSITVYAGAVMRLAPRVIGFIGDSITALLQVTNYFVSALQIVAPQCQATINNQAVSGTTSNDWISGSSNLNSALSAFASAGVADAHYMIGTNDTKTVGQISPAQYKTNVASTCAALNAAGIRVFLSQPITPSENIPTNTLGVWDQFSGGLLNSYTVQLDALVNGKTILQGDRSGYALFANNANYPSFTFDNIHPVGGVAPTNGGPYLAYLWAAAYARSAGLLGAIPSGGGGSSGGRLSLAL
jgi:lysophospholipase L1-like esterase